MLAVAKEAPGASGRFWLVLADLSRGRPGVCGRLWSLCASARPTPPCPAAACFA
jgi:hypothetical protein